MKRKKHVNEFLRTGFEGTGRIAGVGIIEDDYSEEAFPDKYPHRYKPGVNYPDKGHIEPAPVITYYCPMTNENVAKYGLTDKQVKNFCDKGCSVDCEKIFKERWMG